MAERSQGTKLLTYVLLVFALAATSILWWTFAGSPFMGANTNLLYLGEVALQFVVLGVPMVLLPSRRRRRNLQSDQA